jgi:cell division GTPase FtsZ
MKKQVIDDQDNAIVFVVGIGYQGCQAVAVMRQQPEFQDLPCKYVAIDNMQGKLNDSMADEFVMIETRFAENDAHLVLFDASIQDKLDNCGTPDSVFIISAFEDQTITAIHLAIAGYFYKPDQTRVVTIIIEPESGLERLFIQKLNTRIKQVSDCVIESTSSQIRNALTVAQPEVITVWYWTYQYQAVANIVYGIIAPLFFNYANNVDLADIRDILQSSSVAKAVYVSDIGENQAINIVNQACALLLQEGWSLADPAMTHVVGHIIKNGDLIIDDAFDQINAIFQQNLTQGASDTGNPEIRLMMTRNKSLAPDELGLFLLAVKTEILMSETDGHDSHFSKERGKVLADLDVPDFLRAKL